MVEFVRKKKFQREFIRVCLGEQDLAFLASSCPLMRDSRIAELAKRLRTISKITSPGKKNDSAPQNEPYLRPQGPRFVERTAIL